VRRGDGRTAGRAHGWCRSDRTDPGLCRRQAAGDDRGGADGNRVRPSDAERNDARKRAVGLRAGAALLSSRHPATDMRAGAAGLALIAATLLLGVFVTVAGTPVADVRIMMALAELRGMGGGRFWPIVTALGDGEV